jgi:ABC-type Co2+ transport system permease subunit
MRLNIQESIWRWVWIAIAILILVFAIVLARNKTPRKHPTANLCCAFELLAGHADWRVGGEG